MYAYLCLRGFVGKARWDVNGSASGAGQTSPLEGACSMVGKTVLSSSSVKSPVGGEADRARKSCYEGDEPGREDGVLLSYYV